VKRLLLALAAMAAALVVAVLAAPSSGRAHDDEDETYSLGLWGDVPYSDAQQTVGVPNLIADMNRSRLAFSAHVGDLTQGSGSPCDEALYVRSEGYNNHPFSDGRWVARDRPDDTELIVVRVPGLR
jgi:hypothetical protein